MCLHLSFHKNKGNNRRNNTSNNSSSNDSYRNGDTQNNDDHNNNGNNKVVYNKNNDGNTHNDKNHNDNNNRNHTGDNNDALVLDYCFNHESKFAFCIHRTGYPNENKNPYYGSTHIECLALRDFGFLPSCVTVSNPHCRDSCHEQFDPSGVVVLAFVFWDSEAEI